MCINYNYYLIYDFISIILRFYTGELKEIILFSNTDFNILLLRLFKFMIVNY